MILKCIVAYGRWMWGISPAFYQIQSPINEGDALLIWFGILLDVIAVIAVVGILGFLVSIWPFKRKKEGGNDGNE